MRAGRGVDFVPSLPHSPDEELMEAQAFAYLSICLSVGLSIHLCMHVGIYLSIYLVVYGCLHKLRVLFVGVLAMRALLLFGSVLGPLIFENSHMYI